VLLNNYDFEFAIAPEDVGMKTGATIHTMNGLQMRAQRVSPTATPPRSDGWWERQHLKRGLNANGRHYPSEEEAAWQAAEHAARRDDADPSGERKTGGCPMH
jgi:hypothetical protein